MSALRTDHAHVEERVKSAILLQCRLFKDIPPHEIAELSSCSSLATFKKGASLFHDGDAADFFYAVQDGLVKVFKSTPTGKHLTFTVAGPGDTLNATAITVGSYYMSAYALNDVTVIKIGKKPYLAFLAKHPDVAVQLVAMLAKRLNRECDRVVNLLGAEVGQRIIVSLMALVRKFGPRLSITREELANCAGTTTETAIRVLSQLKKNGVIDCTSERRGITVSDVSKLKNLVLEDEGWF
ncbi:MAG TPA: Crp/Fnr family transcriptional regulator [Syntrophorhabdaceae bacterium]|nr:Crp/Fnr family transcriptional regulator [Syntrophorhabdaceae bacterium]